KARPVEAFGNTPEEAKQDDPMGGVVAKHQDHQVGGAAAEEADPDRGPGANPAPQQAVGDEGARNHERAQPAVEGDRCQVVAGPPEKDRQEGAGHTGGGGGGGAK